MKRVIALLLVLITAFSLSACDKKRKSVKYSSDLSSENNLSAEDDVYNSEDLVESKNSINPFENLSVEFGGVSPFCSIVFDESKCSEYVQNNVQFSLEPDKITLDKNYKKGDTVTVYASLRNSYSETETYSLYPNSKTYKVEDVPEYLTALTEDIDLTKFKSELKDSLDAYTAWKKGDGCFDYYFFIELKKITRNDVYFISLKNNSNDIYDSENGEKYFNKIDVFYTVNVRDSYWGNEEDRVHSFALTAKNIVKYPDGTIGWGERDPASLDFQNNWNENQIDLINGNIISKKADYNVAKVTDLFK